MAVEDFGASADAETGSRASTEPPVSRGFGPSGFDPARGVSAFVGVLCALLRDCPDEWERGGYASGLIHAPTKIEIWRPNTWFDAKIYSFGSSDSIQLRIVDRFRIYMAARITRQFLDQSEDVERLKKLQRDLANIRDNVVQFRGKG